eukprot:960634-Rhodomonas_salina.4
MESDLILPEKRGLIDAEGHYNASSHRLPHPKELQLFPGRRRRDVSTAQCSTSADGWRMEDGGWRMEGAGWIMEDGGWRMEDGGKRRGGAPALLAPLLEFGSAELFDELLRAVDIGMPA